MDQTLEGEDTTIITKLGGGFNNATMNIISGT